MPTITVKKIPPDIYELLKQSAEANRRSINSEIITVIERALRGRKVNVEELLTSARQLRRRTRRAPITDAAFNKAKVVGRK